MAQPKTRSEITPEIRRFLELEIQKRNPSIRLAVSIMWYIGLRVSEVTQLDWKQITLLNTSHPSIEILAHQTKTRTPRILPIPIPLRRALELDAAAEPDQLPLHPPTGLVVHHHYSGAPLTTRAIQYAITDACGAANVGKFSPHSFRHSFATRLLRVSNIRLTQLALGHASITSTALYTHPTLDELELAMTRAALEA